MPDGSEFQAAGLQHCGTPTVTVVNKEAQLSLTTQCHALRFIGVATKWQTVTNSSH